MGTTISDRVSRLHARYRGSAIDVVDDDRRFFGGGGAADAATERDSRVGRGLAHVGAEHQLVSVEKIDADPRVVRHAGMEEARRLRHCRPGIGRAGNRRSNRIEQCRA